MNYTFFYGGPFSQWCPCSFSIGGQEYNCAEQWMMAAKARLFNDPDTYYEIMATEHPAQQKALGRTVKNFSQTLWEKEAKLIVYRGNFHKFTQNANLAKELIETYPNLLVEASPTDRIWGIGLGETDPSRLDRKNWRGTNWLGEILTQVRNDQIATRMDWSQPRYSYSRQGESTGI